MNELNRDLRHLLPWELVARYGGAGGVLIAGGLVPFTGMGTTKNYVGKRHVDELDMNNTAVIVWMKDGRSAMQMCIL